MNKHGNLHRAMLFVILFAGFGLGLGLPALHRYTDQKHTRQVLSVLRELGRAERVFYEKNRYYTADFAGLLNTDKCEQAIEKDQSVLACPGYVIGLEEAQVLRAQSTKYPQWLLLPLEGGQITCEYEEGSLVGEKLCAAVHL